MMMLNFFEDLDASKVAAIRAAKASGKGIRRIAPALGLTIPPAVLARVYSAQARSAKASLHGTIKA
jgi:hypothetical protein